MPANTTTKSAKTARPKTVPATDLEAVKAAVERLARKLLGREWKGYTASVVFSPADETTTPMVLAMNEPKGSRPG